MYVCAHSSLTVTLHYLQGKLIDLGDNRFAVEIPGEPVRWIFSRSPSPTTLATPSARWSMKWSINFTWRNLIFVFNYLYCLFLCWGVVLYFCACCDVLYSTHFIFILISSPIFSFHFTSLYSSLLFSPHPSHLISSHLIFFLSFHFQTPCGLVTDSFP